MKCPHCNKEVIRIYDLYSKKVFIYCNFCEFKEYRNDERLNQILIDFEDRRRANQEKRVHM